MPSTTPTKVNSQGKVVVDKKAAAAGVGAKGGAKGGAKNVKKAQAK